jgi:hypothetical protein
VRVDLGTRTPPPPPSPDRSLTHQNKITENQNMLTAPTPRTVTGTILRTSGAEQVVVTHCPTCRQAHRHLAIGLRVPACGVPYVVRIKS